MPSDSLAILKLNSKVIINTANNVKNGKNYKRRIVSIEIETKEKS
jgi:hypothetical protein